jgi:hypothetical protein
MCIPLSVGWMNTLEFAVRRLLCDGRTSGLYQSFLEFCDAPTGIDICPPNRLRALVMKRRNLRARSVTDVKIPGSGDRVSPWRTRVPLG